MDKRVAIVQSNYIPWKGYFDLMDQVDEFIIYDDAQYTRRDWRNRNRVKTSAGVTWLTIPVLVRGRFTQRINETLVDGHDWAAKHWETLRHSYGRAAGFETYRDRIMTLYSTAAALNGLSEINRLFLVELRDMLGIRTPLVPSSVFDLHGNASERLAGICVQAGATAYLTGPSARSYLDETPFALSGIRVDYMSYDGYPEYPQVHPPFEHAVSVVDLVLNVGDQARDFMSRR